MYKFDIKFPLRWRVCLSASLFFFYEFIQFHMFNAISPDLMKDFKINAAQLGYLSSTYFIADVLFLLPAGLILDKFSVRNIILVAMLLCITSTIAFALVDNYTYAAIAHGISGIGNAFCFLSCIVLVSKWFPDKQQALIIGIIVTIGMSGGIVAQVPLEYLSQLYGWRRAILLDSLLGIIIIFIMWWNIQDFPVNNAQQVNFSCRRNTLNLIQNLKLVASNRTNWLYGIYSCALDLPMIIFCAIWGKIFLSQIYNITEGAMIITSSFLYGSILGAPLLCWLSDRAQSRKPLMYIGGIISLLLIIVLLYLPIFFTKNELMILFFLLGFFSSSKVIIYPAINEINSSLVTGTANSLASMIVLSSAAFMQPLMGWLLDFYWQGETIKETRIYTSNDFLFSFSIMPLFIFIGLIALNLANNSSYKKK